MNSTVREMLISLLKLANSCADSQFCILELRPVTKLYCFRSSVLTSSVAYYARWLNTYTYSITDLSPYLKSINSYFLISIRALGI